MPLPSYAPLSYVLEIKTLPRSASALSLDAVPQRGTAGPAGGAVAAAGGARRASGGGVGALAVGSAAASAAGGAARISSEGVGGAAGGEGDAPRLLQWLQGVCPGASLLQRDENRYTFSVPRYVRGSVYPQRPYATRPVTALHARIAGDSLQADKDG